MVLICFALGIEVEILFLGFAWSVSERQILKKDCNGKPDLVAYEYFFFWENVAQQGNAQIKKIR